MHKNFAHGALPPDQFAWQVGKTAASICYVNQAERLLAETLVSADPAAQRLRERVDRVKSGDEAVLDFMTDDQIIEEACK